MIVALAILGTGILALIQLYSASLRSTQRSWDSSKAIIEARSALEEALMKPGTPEPATGELADGSIAETAVQKLESTEEFTVYEVSVRVHAPNKKGLELKGKKVVYEEEAAIP